jgi:hypothetical protein
MRKMMTKEVTSTVVKVARIEVEQGEPKLVELEPVILLGNIDSEKAQKIVAKQYGLGVTVLSVEADTKIYELEVAEFIQIARLRETPLTDEEKAESVED